MNNQNLHESLFQALLDNLTDAIYFKDKDSKFTLCNKSQARNLGAENQDELVGKDDSDYFGPVHSKAARKEEIALMESGQAMPNKVQRADFPDGRVQWHLSSKAPLKDQNGEVIGLLGITKNITELKETQDKLIEAQQRITEESRNAGRAEIASIVIHNVGNMLNSVNITASMIDRLSHQHEDLDLLKLCDSIHSQIENPTMDSRDYLEKIAKYLKAATDRTKNGQAEFRAEVENLKEDVARMQRIILVQQDLVTHLRDGQFREWKEVIEDALEINKVALERHEVGCHKEFVARPDIEIPEFQVLQILLNFISNSKYSFDQSKGGMREIFVRVFEEDEFLKIAVRDNGIGINEGDLDHIFELGFTTREEGHGIGLHGSRMAAKEINSRIDAESDGVGKGATFTLSIPLTECRLPIQ